MRHYLKINWGALVLTVSLWALGVLCIFISDKDFITVFSYIAAAFLFIIGIYMILSAFFYKRFLAAKTKFLDSKVGYLVQGAVLITLSVLLVLFEEYTVRIAIGLTFIALPTYRLFFSSNKKRYLLNNLWKYIVGIIFILDIDLVIQILFIVLGFALIGLGGLVIYLLIVNYRDPDKPNILSKYMIIYIVKRQGGILGDPKKKAKRVRASVKNPEVDEEPDVTDIKKE